jgi:hypothetical protein
LALQRGSGRSKEGSTSFLKKRSKKLYLFSLAVAIQFAAKKFFGSFFQKRTCFPFACAKT